MTPTTLQIIGAILFAVAVLHTFSVSFFARLAEKHPSHAGLWELFAEVEFAFGFWAGILLIFIALTAIETEEGSFRAVTQYLESRSFTEPLFVLTIMIVAASKPVLLFASATVQAISRIVPVPRAIAFYFTTLAVVPLLSSFITEPAAMALAAMILKEAYYRKAMSPRLMYATLGVLFVNISIGGTLTSFAAPPVLMVASTWQWDSWFMLTHIGWRSALAVFVNALAVSWVFRKELLRFEIEGHNERSDVPPPVIALHLVFLSLIVFFVHHPHVFIGILLLFLAFARAYPRFHDRLILRESLMVSCFLAGLVTLGGQQSWWLQPLLSTMDSSTVYYGATALTAITDNAALTYLGSLVQGLSDEFKYALVTGAVTGGGLTVIANAPNPAGMSILQGHFKGGKVNPLGLLAAAALPTLMAIAAFRFV
ncbi:MAG: putative Na+/H+ antiporter [Azoarcus sp.]|jgi:Na+/H+ antiporter NhaD/arsenite permease-like protein|nr:putative Na+/H+ antiporter [Azoarcus sp.]